MAEASGESTLINANPTATPTIWAAMQPGAEVDAMPAKVSEKMRPTSTVTNRAVPRNSAADPARRCSSLAADQAVCAQHIGKPLQRFRDHPVSDWRGMNVFHRVKPKRCGPGRRSRQCPLACRRASIDIVGVLIDGEVQGRPVTTAEG